jgi:hypothetical protein
MKGAQITELQRDDVLAIDLYMYKIDEAARDREGAAVHLRPLRPRRSPGPRLWQQQQTTGGQSEIFRSAQTSSAAAVEFYFLDEAIKGILPWQDEL